MKRNYHTHNSLCGHAEGTIEDYVTTALDAGMVELGMSDHVPFEGDRVPYRMQHSDMDVYCRTTRELKQKYAGRIKLYCGFEAEYLPEKMSYYTRLLDEGKVEYFLLGQHYFYDETGCLVDIFRNFMESSQTVAYARSAVEGMATGIFKYLAHPDAFMIGGWQPDRYTDEACDIILDAAVKYDYLLELNANGLRHDNFHYPAPYFWEKAAAAGVRVILAADAHSPQALCDEAIGKAEKMAQDLNLKVTDKIF